MHTLSLHPHADGKVSPDRALSVAVTRPKRSQLVLRFSMVGDAVRHLRLPRPLGDRPARHDGLWRHSCFELFVRLGASEAYLEYNFAPSGDWACYAFDGYRAGMTSPRVPEPRIETWLHFPRGADRVRGTEQSYDGVTRDFAAPFFQLTATVDLDFAVVRQPHDPWRLGLSAVLEENSGIISHWALAHPPGAPDFHHPDCFALELPAARPA